MENVNLVVPLNNAKKMDDQLLAKHFIVLSPKATCKLIVPGFATLPSNRNHIIVKHAGFLLIVKIPYLQWQWIDGIDGSSRHLSEKLNIMKRPRYMSVQWL